MFFLCRSEQTGLLCTSNLNKPEKSCSNGVFWLTTKLKSSTCKLIWCRLLKLKKLWSVESVLDVFQLIMLITFCSPNKVLFFFYKLEQQRKVFSLIMKLVTLGSTGLHRYMMHMVRTHECFCLFFKLILDGTEALMLSTCGQTDSCGSPWPPNFWSHSLMLTKFLYRHTCQSTQTRTRSPSGPQRQEDKCTQTHELKILPALLSWLVKIP